MTETMRAARWHGRRDVRVEDVPIPRVGPGDVLLRVSWCGICGTDAEEYRDGPVVIPATEPNALTGQRAPITLGHEFAGVVVEVGPGVEGFAVGDRVAPEICLSCGECWYCSRGDYALCRSWAAIGLHGDGGLAEFVKVPARMCLSLPDAIADDEAALIETTEVAVRAVRKAGIRPGDSVAVVGDGAVGLCGVIAARRLGAERILILGRHPDRTDLAREFGATDVVAERGPEATERVRELTGGEGAHSVLECVGLEQAFETAVRIARPGGAVGRVGVPQFDSLPAAGVSFVNNVTVSGGIAPARAYIDELLPEVLDGALQPGRVFDSEIPLAEVPGGYRAMDERESIKVMVKP